MTFEGPCRTLLFLAARRRPCRRQLPKHALHNPNRLSPCLQRSFSAGASHAYPAIIPDPIASSSSSTSTPSSPSSSPSLSTSSQSKSSSSPKSSQPPSLASQLPSSGQPLTHANSARAKSGSPAAKLDYVPPEDASTSVRLARTLRDRVGGVTEPYIAYGATEKLYKQCAARAQYSVPQARERGAEIPVTPEGVQKGVGEGWWYNDLGLTPTFNNWAQVTMLHIYFFVTRIRHFPAAHAPQWQQHLLDHFFHDAEEHMVVEHHMTVRGARTRYLKDLYIQYRGALAGYDEGLCSSDAVLATALWRNILAADENVDLRNLALLVAYFRNTVRAMELIPDESVAAGLVKFADPARFRELVPARSKMLDQPFDEVAQAKPQLDESVADVPKA